MKIIRIFGVVLAIHVVGGILFIQPGCQSQPRPQTTETTPATGAPTERLDWENWEEDSSVVRSDRPRSTPTRPASRPTTSSSRDDSTLSPLPSGLEPLPGSSTSGVPRDGGSYTVRSGDSLWVIANRNNVSLRDLLAVNNLTENSVIQPGQELRLPAGGSSSGSSGGRTSSTGSNPPSGTTTYTVRSGDSLSAIASRHNTTVQDLKALNNLSGDVIRIDQKLVVPEGGSQSAARPRTSGATSAGASSSGETHTVQAGETPGGIASRYGISVDDLMSANGISDPRRMRIGQQLVIPGGGTSGSGSGSGSDSAQSGGSSSQGSANQSGSSREPVPRAPTPRDIPVLEPEDDDAGEEEDFPVIPIVPSN